MPGPTASDRTSAILVRVSPELREQILDCARRAHGLTASEYMRRVLASAVAEDQRKMATRNFSRK
jgi:hypothetical protein